MGAATMDLLSMLKLMDDLTAWSGPVGRVLWLVAAAWAIASFLLPFAVLLISHQLGRLREDLRRVRSDLASARADLSALRRDAGAGPRL